MSVLPGPTRRLLLQWIAGMTTGAAALPLLTRAAGKRTAVEVWKDPSCGCCNDWIAHMREHDFDVTAHDVGGNAVRARLGLPRRYASCHTALVEGYVVEGHVAAAEVRRLLHERPDALGLAVPGMPVGSPGMDGPVYGGRQDTYETLLVLRDGRSRVFQKHG